MELLLAREEPRESKQSTRMYLAYSEVVEMPKFISKPNSSTETIKKFLNNLFRLPNIGLEPGKSGFRTNPPGFRDLLAFNFQPQNIVANPNALFFRTETFEYRERLKAIFPFAIGAIDARSLVARWELKDVEQRLRQLETNLSAKQFASDAWRGEISAWIARAKEYNLVSNETRTDLAWPEMLSLLQRISEANPSESTPSAKAIDSSISRLAEIRSLEESSAMELGLMRRRRAEMQKLRDAIPAASDSLLVQKERLDLSRWLKQRFDENHSCPICGSHFETAQDDLETLLGALETIEVQVKALNSQPESFAREYQRVGSQLRILVKKLNEFSEERRVLESGSRDDAEIRFKENEIARFTGQLHQALKVYYSLNEDSELKRETIELQSRKENLLSIAYGRGVSDRQKNAVEIVNEIAQLTISSLDAEEPERKINFDLGDLTIKLIGDDRNDYLWEIGSGANWLSYHIAMMLGFHGYFLKQPFSSVPSFLILDQPSQVYFPRSNATEDKSGNHDLAWHHEDDIQAVRRIFKTLLDAINASNDKLQIIVMDHASKDIWGELPNIYEVGDWRNGKKLVPDHWPSR